MKEATSLRCPQCGARLRRPVVDAKDQDRSKWESIDLILRGRKDSPLVIHRIDWAKFERM